MKRVAVIGGGITGLTTALDVIEKAEAAGQEIEVTVLEAGEEPGGNIRTERIDGYTIENGPNGFLDNAPKTLELVRRIGIQDALQPADETAGKRFIYRNGALREVPTGPISFLKSPLLSITGRLRLFGEPFARSKPEGDETIYHFAARRIGPEAASVLVDAMVSGVFAGNVHELSLQSSFPKMAKMEAEHGGLVKAMVAGMKKRRAARKEVQERRARGEDVEALTAPGGPAGPGGHLTSFENGLDTLVQGLMDALPEGTVRTGSPVERVISRSPTSPRPEKPGRSGSAASSDSTPNRAWQVALADGESLEADAVVVTIPSPRAAPLLQGLDSELSETVGQIETAGLAVVAFGWDAAQVAPPDGFGFLVPRGEGPRILGCLWDSSVFPGRAPDGKVLVRCMIGGAHDLSAVTEPEADLVARCRADLEDAMGIVAEPELVRVYRWPLGIGQYTVGHQDRLDTIHDRLAEHPGLWVAGSSYYGVAMNACIEKAWDQAGAIVAYLANKN